MMTDDEYDYLDLLFIDLFFFFYLIVCLYLASRTTTRSFKDMLSDFLFCLTHTYGPKQSSGKKVFKEIL